MTTTSSVRGFGQLLTYLPWAFEFVPDNSLIVTGLRDGAVAFNLRLDPPHPHHETEWAKDIGAPGAPHADVVVLTRWNAPDLSRRAMDLIAASYRRAGVALDHLLEVRDGQWWARRCTCGTCPVTPRPLPQAHQVAMVTEQIARGVHLDGSRRAIYERLAPVAAEVVDPGDTTWPEEDWALLLDLIDPHGPPISSLGAERVRRLAVLLGDGGRRDIILRLLVPAWGADPLDDEDDDDDGDDWEEADCPHGCEQGEHDHALRHRLAEWARRTQGPERAGAWALLGTYAWLTQGGAVASIAIEKALEADPDHSLALLVLTAIQGGMRPSPRERRPSA
ncbi:DUF4192 domain-containing protein [Calidifontibacter sp. DB0510]|uniref:DUF4192 domain-containing protein n=1 Tax=Metallococcus carri TaxID=1656884 RepID=A0A967B117_9MICO|nr:DUF4192 domain-containing protein [Metallococcus carri]NHN56049.1 DUF4192 domain-containing protein [Metallococcus carri]NOP37494.1 DUF4192 domain-containing protein [Calidifontibacter sp. DB2511S]